MTRFADQTVLVTGALGGIGGAIVDLFAQAGAALILSDRDVAALEARVAKLAEAGIKAAAAPADLCDARATRAAIDAAVARTGPVDIAVNNAGGGNGGGTLASTSAESWAGDVVLNLNGPYHVVAAVIDGMKARRRGNIVNISSVNGLLTLGHPAYSAAKAGLISYTKALAVEYGPFGIRANVICPGTVRTPIWQARVDRKPEIFESLRKWYPLQRVAEPADIAKAVAFLADDDLAGFITGAMLPVDGGLTAGNRVMAAELTLEEF
ncbi:SDR family oxidoreductase [Inquilinus limosus]|uniref:Short-chain dehydrogenase n=1 Tax=Inquilinus limosus TaxID=171674 RepID=A0A211YX82_9PROT|nr:SDR family oxidoreductase [Inquilinus limosus]OWJ57633.1 short-chain dehydrogenase [Inquilinus limosus]